MLRYFSVWPLLFNLLLVMVLMLSLCDARPTSRRHSHHNPANALKNVFTLTKLMLCFVHLC